MLHSTLINKKKFLIFDFDGTIAATSNIHKKAFEEVFKPFSVEIIYEEIAGKSTKKAVDFILKKNNLILNSSKISQLISKKQLLVREFINSKKGLKALPFAKEFIKYVHSKYYMGIASSGSRETIELSLKKLNLFKYFNLILCSEDVKSSKPSPEIFIKISELANFPKEQCLIFEDSLNGFKAAKKANMDFIDITKYSYMEIQKLFSDS